MDLQAKAHSKRTLPIIGVAVLIILALVFYFSFLRDTAPQLPGDSSGRGDIIPEIELSVLESSVLSRFRSWSVLPVIIGETGRENPFSQE